MSHSNQRGTTRPSDTNLACSSRPAQGRCGKAARTGAEMAYRIGAARPVGWISTGVPLVTCVAVWGVGNVAAAQAPWLPVLHDVVAAAASVWTALQLALKGLLLRQAQAARRLSWPAPGLMAMYALLVLQPVLAAASSMLHGARATMFGTALPAILPVDLASARRIDLLHGLNAVLLLCIIGWQIIQALVALRLSRTGLRYPEGVRLRATNR